MPFQKSLLSHSQCSHSPVLIHTRRLLGAVGLKYSTQAGSGSSGALSSAAKEREAAEAAAQRAAKDAAAAPTLTQQVQVRHGMHTCGLGGKTCWLLRSCHD